MKPDFFQIKRGCYKIGINPIDCFITKKPAIRIECVTNDTHTQDIDGEWVEEYDCSMFTFRSLEDYDLFIKKLQEARVHMEHER